MIKTKQLLEQIDARDFSLAPIATYGHNPLQLAEDEYTRCKTLFEKKSQVQKNAAPVAFEMFIAQLMQSIMQQEAPHIEALKQLAVEVICDLYQVPENIVMKPELGQEIKMEEDMDDMPEEDLSDERKTELLPDIKKRILLNGLAHGSSMHIWKTAHHLVKDKLKEIHSPLFKLYENYTSTIGVHPWFYADVNAMIESVQMLTAKGIAKLLTQGNDKVSFDQDDNPVIEAKAIVFPVLLHELNKGVIDYLILHGINQDLTEGELSYVLQEADKFEYEIWHQFLSPSIWQKLIQDLDVAPEELPEKIKELSLLDYEELDKYLTKIQSDDRE